MDDHGPFNIISFHDLPCTNHNFSVVNCPTCRGNTPTISNKQIIELDDGKIETGNPNQFDGQKPWFPVKIFPNKPIHWTDVERRIWCDPIPRLVIMTGVIGRSVIMPAIFFGAKNVPDLMVAYWGTLW